MKEFICICCPRGCHLKVDNNLNVTGNICIRGDKYGKSEASFPVRMITSSIVVKNRKDTMCSVKTSKEISKQLYFDVIKEIKKIKIDAPLHIGDVIKKDICHSGCDLIVTKNID